MSASRISSILKTAFLTVLLAISAISAAHAEGKDVTPYGDYCKEYSVYGICRRALPPEQAVMVLRRYYRNKGCRVFVVQQAGRFIVADIYRRRRQVDKVIFDMNTGRLRSVY